MKKELLIIIYASESDRAFRMLLGQNPEIIHVQNYRGFDTESHAHRLKNIILQRYAPEAVSGPYPKYVLNSARDDLLEKKRKLRMNIGKSDESYIRTDIGRVENQIKDMKAKQKSWEAQLQTAKSLLNNDDVEFEKWKWYAYKHNIAYGFKALLRSGGTLRMNDIEELLNPSAK